VNFKTEFKKNIIKETWTPPQKKKASGRKSHACDPLKGLSHEIFMVIFWLEWIHIGLKGNRFWFFNFKDVSSILDSNFKF
jgi:hypothetical protein